MLFEVAMIILVVYYFSKDPSHVKDWERHFISHYEAKGNRIVRLKFDSSNVALLIKLCKKKVNKRQMLSYPPCKEINFIAFKKHKHPPFRAEMIRCKKKFAIIHAPGHHCAYVLTKGKDHKSVQGPMFYISEKFCYHPPKETHIDQYPDQYQEREYRANRPSSYEPNNDQYASRGHQPHSSFPYNQHNKSNYYHRAGDSRGELYSHRMIPKTESAYYNPQSQFEDQHQLYVRPSWDEYRNRELRNVRNDPPSQLKDYAQDRRKPLGRYTDHYSHSEELQPSRKEMEPNRTIKDYSPMHSPIHTENHPHFNNENLHYLTRHYQSMPPHQTKSDELYKNIGYREAAFPQGHYSSNNNNQPLPYIQDKLPRYLYSNPHYQISSSYKPGSLQQLRPGEYGKMYPYYESPYFRYETELYDRNAPKSTLENEYQYSYNDSYRQALHSGNQDYLPNKYQPLEDHRFDKLKRNELLNEVNSYEPREVNSESKIILEENIEPHCETIPCNECGNLLHNPAVENTVPMDNEDLSNNDNDHIIEKDNNSSVLQHETTIGNLMDEKNQSSPRNETIQEEHDKQRLEETNLHIPMQEDVCTCNECSSEQSYSVSMYNETNSSSSPSIYSKKYPNLNYSSSNKNNRALKYQLLLKNRDKQLRKFEGAKMQRESYPIYGSKIHQDSYLDKEYKQMYYQGQIYKLEEEPYSSPNQLEKLPPSYLVSYSGRQTGKKPIEHKSNKNCNEDISEEDKLFENHQFHKKNQTYPKKPISPPTIPKREYLHDDYWPLTNANNLSMSNIEKEIEPNYNRDQQRRFRKRHIKPSLPTRTYKQKLLEKVNPLQIVENNSNSDEEENILTSSQDESSFPTVFGDNDHSSDDEKLKLLHELPRSEHNSSNILLKNQKSFGKNNQSRQKKDNCSSKVEEIEQAINKQKSEQSYKKNKFTGKKLEQLHDNTHKKINMTIKHGLSRENDEETMGVSNYQSSLKGGGNHFNDKNKKWTEYPQTRNEINQFKDISDLDEEEELQSSTVDSPISPESQDYDLRTKSKYFSVKNDKARTRNQSGQNEEKNIQSNLLDYESLSKSENNLMETSGYLLTKNKKIKSKSRSDRNKKERNIEPSTPSYTSSSQSRECLSTNTKEIELKSLLEQNKEENIQSNTLSHLSSPKNQEDYNKRVTRSVYPLTGNINQLNQDKKLEHTLSRIPDYVSSSESHVDDGKVRTGHILSKNKEMEAGSQLNQNRQEKIQSSRPSNLNLLRNQEDNIGIKKLKDPSNINKEIGDKDQSNSNEEERNYISEFKSQDNDIKKIKYSHFSENTKASAERQSDLKKETTVQLNTSDSENSPESQDNGRRTTGSEYLLTKKIVKNKNS